MKRLMAVMLALLGLPCTPGTAAAAPQHLHLSWQGDTGTTATVSWRSSATTGSVEYGTSATYGQNVTAASTAYQGSYLHHAQITGLKPGTQYHYRCGTTGDWSADYSFSTAPASTAAYRYIALGDSRTNATARAQVRSSTQSRGPALTIHTGDFVNNGLVQSDWDTWFATMQPLVATSPLMGTLGNHEGNASNYYAQFAFPTHTPPVSGVEGEAFYSFDYASTHFIALSTEHSPTKGDGQYQWLKDDLSKTAKNPGLLWTVAFAHRPPYSSGPHGNYTAAQTAWGHLFESFGVDVTFWGHDHTYERTLPLFQGQAVSKGGVIYIVSGGAGAPLYTISGSYFTAFSKSAYHYVEVNVQGSQMKLEARDASGQVFDSLTLTKSGPKPKWIMDGAQDTGVSSVGSGTGSELKGLYASFDGQYLYVATEGMPAALDHFVLISEKQPTVLRAAPWKKSGQVWTASALLTMESASGWSNWQDPIGSSEQTGFARASNPAGKVMEGLLDLKTRFGTIPGSVFLAAAAYGTSDGQALAEQIPKGNGNGNLDLGEWIELKLKVTPVPDGGTDLTLADGGADAGKKRDGATPGKDGPGKDGPGTPTGDGDEGCSCAVGRSKPARGVSRMPWLLLGPALLLLWRRRRLM